MNLRVSTRVARCPVFDRTVRFLGDVSGPKREAKPDNKLSGFLGLRLHCLQVTVNCVNCFSV
jgi:hypothetical protein